MKKALLLLVIANWALGCLAQSSVSSSPHSPLPTHYSLFFLEAVCQREKGNHDAAFDLLQHCVTLNPEAAEAWYFLAQYYGSMKQQDKMLDCLVKAYELSPSNATYTETLAQAYVSIQRYDEAIGVFEQLVEREPDRDDVLGMLFELYNRSDQLDKAVDALERIEALDGKNERLTMAKSELFTRQGNKKAAIAEMKSLADQYPNDLNYRVMYGDALLQNDQKQQALAVYQEVLKEEPQNVPALLSMVGYYAAEGDTEKADEMNERLLLNEDVETDTRLEIMRREVMNDLQSQGDSTRILRLFHKVLSMPDPEPDMALMCATYMKLREMPKDSINSMYELVLNMVPDNAYARLQLVADAWDREDLDRVVELCKAARQYNPDDMAFYYYQGFAYYRQDDIDHALDAFQNGVSVITSESNPDLASDFYEVMGELLYKKGKVREAFAAYDSCLVWKADRINCLNNYAYYLSELDEQLEKAEQMSFKTIKAEPENATYLDTYAWILFKQGRYAEAKIYIDQTLQYDPDASAVLLEHAGDIYAKCGEMAQAVSYWEQSLAKASDDSEIKAERRELLIRKIKSKKYIRK
ncbi:MAG: tetratricopeptide repeat protein [Prevotella sp.]|nr:tetratricopeptide repeat protein [Prevotella sp.]